MTILGIDSGSTAVKAVFYADDGRALGGATRSSPREEPRPGRVERDPVQHWDVVVDAVRAARAEAGIPVGTRVAIGVAAHGDGLTLVDAAGRTVGPAVLSSDTRAEPVLTRWRHEGVLDRLRERTGQTPLPGSPAPLLRWFAEHAPERLAAARWALSTKDWLRLRMTGVVGTDRTDAGASFADSLTHDYSPDVLALTGLTPWSGLLPPIHEPVDVVGGLLPTVAQEWGLAPDSPVVAGLHDVPAAMIGSVGLTSGVLCVIAGTFGVNVVLTQDPPRSPLVNSRSGPAAGWWTTRRTSRGSSVNVEWVGRATLAGTDRDSRTSTAFDRALAAGAGADGHEPPLYVPFLFGGLHDQPDAAAFLGLRSWHDRDDLLRAVVEGVTFNHREDSETIGRLLPVTDLHLSGGAARRPAWRQLFADAFGRPLRYLQDDDAGTRGAAVCAAVGVGLVADLAAGGVAFAPRTAVVEPGARAAELDERFARYRDAVAAARAFDHPAPVRLPVPTEPFERSTP